ncbi:hypothetical protein A4X13_0g8224, partial [Tilletia indica]
DAASANTRMCDALEYEFKQRSADEDISGLERVVEHRRGDHNIFCFNHVLNRGMVDFYTGMGLKAEDKDAVLKATDESGDVSKEGAEEVGSNSDSDNEPMSDDDGSDAEQVLEGAAVEPTLAATATGSTTNAPADAAMAEVDGEDVRAEHTDGADAEVDPEAQEAEEMFADVRCKLATVREEDEDESNDAGNAEDGGRAEDKGEDVEDEDEDDEDLANPLNKIARMVKQIHCSSDALREFQKWMAMAYRDAPKLSKIVPPKLNQTRWNSRYKQVKVALKIREGLLLYGRNSNRPKVVAIGLTERDFDIAQQIKLVSSYVHRQTLLFERNASNACLVLHLFGELVYILNVEIEEARSKPGPVAAKLKTGLEQMRTKVKRYQQAASLNKTLLLASILHPRYRLGTFEADYPTKVDHVKELLNEEVRACSDNPVGPSQPPVVGTSRSVLPKEWRRDLPDISSATIRAEQTEVDAYLANRNPYRVAKKGSKVAGDTVLELPSDDEEDEPSKTSSGTTPPPSAQSSVPNAPSSALSSSPAPAVPAKAVDTSGEQTKEDSSYTDESDSEDVVAGKLSLQSAGSPLLHPPPFLTAPAQENGQKQPEEDSDREAVLAAPPPGQSDGQTAAVQSGFAGSPLLDLPPPHASHLTLRDARSRAARRTLQGTAEGLMIQWHLEDVLVYDPKKPPSRLKKTKGSKLAHLDEDGKQVKEIWRCRRKGCNAVRTVDPGVTNAMTRHSRTDCPALA